MNLVDLEKNIMQKNAYLDAKIGFDTTSKEPSENADLVVGTWT